MGAPQYEQAGADIGGTGTTNTIPRWTGASTLGDSGITDNGTAIYTTTRDFAVGIATPSATSTIYKANNSLGAWNAQDFSVNGLSNGDAVYQRWYATGVAGAVGRFGVTFQSSVASFVWNSLFNSGVQTAELMRLTGGGNLGIGTASPVTRVQIVGERISDYTAGLVIGPNTFPGWSTRTSSGGATSYFNNWNSANTSSFLVATGSNTAMGEIMRFDHANYTVILPQATSGLKLPATPGNADTQTLDCYQENTGWVPTITFGGASTGMTYTTQAGSWTKIGNLVFVTGRIVLSAKGSSTGVARLANLPVAVGASNASGGGMVGPVANITFGGQLAIYAVASATTLGLAKNTSGGAAVDLTDADFTNTSDITFSCIYRV